MPFGICHRRRACAVRATMLVLAAGRDVAVGPSPVQNGRSPCALGLAGLICPEADLHFRNPWCEAVDCRSVTE